MNKRNIIISLIFMLILVLLFIVFKPKKKKTKEIEEIICTKNCKSGDTMKLKDGSIWHVISYSKSKVILFSDANIDLEGNYLPVDKTSLRNTGQPVAFDKKNVRTTEKNPYCIYPDLGCSVYEKNNIDVFEDSSIKKLIDTKFVPKIKETLETDDIIVRLLKRDEFLFFKELQNQNKTYYNWLYYSGYWLISGYNQYSVYAIEEGKEQISNITPYIAYKVGIRPVIEVSSDLFK